MRDYFRTNTTDIYKKNSKEMGTIYITKFNNFDKISKLLETQNTELPQ